MSKHRNALPFGAGLLLGLLLGALAPGLFQEIAFGALGYLLFLGALICLVFLIVFGQDALEGIYRAVSSHFRRPTVEPSERQKTEDRPPVNPWGWPNIRG